MIEEIYRKSIANLPRALREVELVAVRDNTNLERETELLLTTRNGRVTYLHPEPPEWLRQAMRGTEYDLERLREEL